ncbi:hypothetical protein MTO96_022550 [Rhipicephalus appendiculatus]
MVVAKVPQGKPAPDIQHLALRAARRRAERQALKRAQPEFWTVFRKVDAVCRRRADRRRNQGWVSVCVSIDRSRDGTRAWRLLKCLLMVPRAFNQVLSLAVHLTIQAADLAEQLADQFAARDIAQLPAAPPPAALQCPASCHHPGWIAVQVVTRTGHVRYTLNAAGKPFAFVERIETGPWPPFMVPNRKSYTRAALSDEAVVLYGGAVDVYCLPLRSVGSRRKAAWSAPISLVKGVALGDGWVAVACAPGLLRLFTAAGVQLSVWCLPGRHVAAVGHGQQLALFHHAVEAGEGGLYDGGCGRRVNSGRGVREWGGWSGWARRSFLAGCARER